ncbi:MAG: hypothetical protein ACKO01_11465 [Erythrobacter sp.]
MPDVIACPRLVLAAVLLAEAGSARADPPPVPPPTEQLTADCSRPVYATDQLVCADATLRDLDVALAARLAVVPQPTARWVEPQWEWFRRRSRCAFSASHRACVEAAYRERLVVLAPPRPMQGGEAARCSDADIAAVGFADGWTYLLGRSGDVLGAGWSGPGAHDWQPYLTAARSGSKLQLRTLAGAALTCRLQGGPATGAR